jgi:hypothetical protein
MRGDLRSRVRGVKRGLLVAAVVLALAAPAHASTTISSEHPRYQRWVDEALVPTPETTVVVSESAESAPCRPFGAGCADGDRIWVNPRDPYLRAVFLHELGHVFEHHYLDDSVRAQFQRITADDRAWSGPWNPPREQFAEAYSMCARWAERPRRIRMWMYGWKPSPPEHRQACRLIRRAAAV